jgi:hypothetical protein
MIDLARTFSLISGGITDSEQTWRNYLPDAGDWQKTAVLLTVPLIILAAVGAYVFGFLGSDGSFFGRFRPTIISTIFTIITSAIVAVVVAFIVSALAGTFGGKNSFALGLAATTFAFIPGYIGQVLRWVPWIGMLLALGLSIYGMVLLWKIIPIYLNVPDAKRTPHYILSLLASIVAVFILSATVGRFMMPTMGGPDFSVLSDSDSPGSSATSGMFGGIVRQAELMAAAEEDDYDAPSDGRLSKDQVREFIRVMQRTGELQEQKMRQLKELTEKAENEEDLSFSELGKMMGGVTEVGGLPSTEIEVVKSAGGNWAEHQWVSESLRTAWVQKDINDAVAHNYELYMSFEDELSDFIAR